MDVDDTVERSYVQVVAVKERGWRRPGHGPSPCLFALALMAVCAGDFLCLFYGFDSALLKPSEFLSSVGLLSHRSDVLVYVPILARFPP